MFTMLNAWEEWRKLYFHFSDACWQETASSALLSRFWNLVRYRARICKRFRCPEIDSKESIPPAYVAWRVGTSNRAVLPARQAGNRFLGSLKGLQTPKQTKYFVWKSSFPHSAACSEHLFLSCCKIHEVVYFPLTRKARICMLIPCVQLLSADTNTVSDYHSFFGLYLT